MYTKVSLRCFKYKEKNQQLMVVIEWCKIISLFLQGFNSIICLSNIYVDDFAMFILHVILHCVRGIYTMEDI